jgi:hypothetical protein
MFKLSILDLCGSVSTHLTDARKAARSFQLIKLFK